MVRLKFFIFSVLILCDYTKINGQNISLSEYGKNHILSNLNMSLLLRDSSGVDIFTSGSVEFPIRISIVRKSAKPINGGSGTQVYYQGGLVGGITHLLNTNTFYVRTKGKVPDETIFYYGSKNFADTTNMNKKIENILADKYKFNIINIYDTCIVWKIQKMDTTKLIRYNEEKDGMDFGSGPDETGKNLFCVGFPLSFLYKSIEQKAKIIVVGDAFDDNWDNRYNFGNIPYSSMTDLGALNKLLEDCYGIKFIKTRVLQKLKLIEFEN